MSVPLREINYRPVQRLCQAEQKMTTLLIQTQSIPLTVNFPSIKSMIVSGESVLPGLRYEKMTLTALAPSE